MKKILLGTVIIFCHFVWADFPDIEYAWYRDSIIELQRQGLTRGYEDGTFGVENNITRAEILTILLRANNLNISETTMPKCFPDVDTNMWYHKYICTAHTLGIASGFDDGKFKPNNPVTTLEALAFANKVFQTGVITTGIPWYTGLQDFSDTQHIIPTHSYTKNTKITRGKSADMIVRFQEFKKTNAPLSLKSLGCTSGNIFASGEHTLTLKGIERKYNLFVPANYSNTKEYSLIIATHGRTNSKDEVQRYMGLERGQTDFIVVYPAALKNSSGTSFSWSEKENMVFIDALLHQISENLCINRDQIHVVGHSLGGWMAQKIACLRGEFIHSLAVVGSGGYYGTCSGPVRSLFFQNTNDHLSSYESGISARKTRLTVNDCDTTSTINISIGTLTCINYNACSKDNQVVWCEGYTGYNGDPHSWPTPNGGRDILGFLRGR